MNGLSHAEILLQSLGITEPEQIDIEGIAFHVGAVIEYKPLKGCIGRIVGFNNKAVITVNERSIKPRRLYTAAHELGHWHHHRNRSFICGEDDIGNMKTRLTNPERVADHYAADLILPKYLFEPLARQLGKASFKTVADLKEVFKTSTTATSIRFVDHGPEPTMLVCHTPRGRKWFHAHKDVPASWFPNKELHADSYALDVLYGKMDHSGKRLMGADAWFSRRGARKYEIYEETISVYKGETLTLLSFKDLEMLEDE